VWAWQGWASPKQALYVADLLLGLDQWAHGVVMLRLAVPDDQVLCTSYHAWNDFLNPDAPAGTTLGLRRTGCRPSPASLSRGWLPHHPNKSWRAPEPGDDGCAMTDRWHPAHAHFGPRFEHWPEVLHDVTARGNVIAA
jgi:hypothetical protein